jgi:hypothetical protein
MGSFTFSASVDPQRFWTLDSLRHQGHDHSEVLAFLSYLADEEDEVRVRRESGVVTTAGIDVGPRPRRGLLGRLLGGR